MTTSSERSFLFIGGLHRSGTSILFQLIREHPQTSGFRDTGVSEDEGMHLQSVFYPSGHYGGAGRFGFHPEAHLTEQSPLVSDENREKLFSEWSRYWNLEKPVLLEKSPPNLIRARFLQAMFPNSHFVMLIRHPIAVSYATQAWYRRARISLISLHRLIEHWLRCHEMLRTDRKHLRRITLVKYEDFVEDPQGCLDKVYASLELESFPVTLQVRREINQKYFQKWHKRSRAALGKISVPFLVKRFEDRINTFGYSLVDLEWSAAVSWKHAEVEDVP